MATTVSGRSFPYASGLRRRLQGPPAASSATCRSMSSSPGWPLTRDQQQNSVARDPGRYTRRARGIPLPVTATSLPRRIAALVTARDDCSGALRYDPARRRLEPSTWISTRSGANRRRSNLAENFLSHASGVAAGNRTRVPLRALPQKYCATISAGGCLTKQHAAGLKPVVRQPAGRIYRPPGWLASTALRKPGRRDHQ